MATAEIKIIKPSPTTREEQRDKASFDASMVHIRDVVHVAGRDAISYYHRELIAVIRSMERKHGLSVR